jgi:excinuclease ABC subunit A
MINFAFLQKHFFLKNQEYIEVYGARVHNLKNIDVKIPREKLVVITGLRKDKDAILRLFLLMHVSF